MGKPKYTYHWANSGWYTSWENKKFYLRSSYEFKFAKMLDEQKISYEVENPIVKYFDTQENKIRNAKPDFYIPSENLIIEIKSKYTLDMQNMIDRKKAYIENGYNFKCICNFEEIEI